MNHFNRTAIVGIALAVLATVSLTACDAFTDGFDRNPNLATDAPADLVLTGALVGNIVVHEANLARVSNIFSGQFTGSDRQYQVHERYEAFATDFDNMWNRIYKDGIAQADIAVQKAAEAPNPHVMGMGQVVKAQIFGTTTALFGDIPFTETNDPEIANPAFDPQDQVYAGIQDLLDEAIQNLEAIGISPEAQDIFFGGNPEPWIEVAHTLKARYYLHTGNFAQARMHAEQGISVPANSMIATHGNTRSADMNVYNQFLRLDRPSYLTANTSHLVELLNPESEHYRGSEHTDEAARFAHYFAFGLSGEGNIDPNYGEGGYFAPTASFPLVSYEENQLILAEAALIADGDEEAAIDALNSVRAVHALQYPAGTYAPFDAGDFATGNDLLHEILTEKYITLYGEIEAFTDLRRTENFIGVPPKTGDRLPQRILYAQTELNSNANAPTPIPGIMEPTPINAAMSYPGAN